MADGEVLACVQRDDGAPHWFKSRCGYDRDCIPDDRSNPFAVGWCGAMAWVAKGSGRTVEVWDGKNARRLFTITSRAATFVRRQRCEAAGRGRNSAFVGSRSSGEEFTVNIPGISDVLRIPGLDTPEIRRQRYQRWLASRSPVPEVLQPLTRILNKLDDAQDLLFTALALAVPILKRIGLRMIPFLGWALTVNDILNGMT